jgi:hypothetical protein
MKCRAPQRFPMAWWTRQKYDFHGSLYREPCPACGAPPFCWCVTHKTGKRSCYPHPERRGTTAPSIASREGFHQRFSGGAP